MEHLPRLMSGKYFHIFNRGHNREELFHEEENYRFFLRLYAKYIVPVADTFAYCLLKNHFHLLVRIKSVEELTAAALEAEVRRKGGLAQSKVLPGLLPPRPLNPAQRFSNLFNAYAKAFNKRFKRTGEVFEKRFHRKEILSDEYFAQLLFYIHFNPEKHGAIHDFRKYRYSSYKALTGSGRTNLAKSEVMKKLGGRAAFIQFHDQARKEKGDQIFDADLEYLYADN